MIVGENELKQELTDLVLARRRPTTPCSGARETRFRMKVSPRRAPTDGERSASFLGATNKIFIFINKADRLRRVS